MIEVRGRRGHHHYRYVAFPKVKPAKVQKLIDKHALEVAAHEGGGQFKVRFDNGPEDDNGYIPVIITLVGADCEFIVIGTPLEGAP